MTKLADLFSHISLVFAVVFSTFRFAIVVAHSSENFNRPFGLVEKIRGRPSVGEVA